MQFPAPAKLRDACMRYAISKRKDTVMIYSHKTDTHRHNLSREETAKLRKLLLTAPTAWMIDEQRLSASFRRPPAASAALWKNRLPLFC